MGERQFDPEHDLLDTDLWPAEEQEKPKATPTLVRTKKPTRSSIPQRSLRQKKKLARDLEAAWMKCTEGKDWHSGFTMVPDVLRAAIARSGCSLKDVATYALMLAIECRWLLVSRGGSNRWDRGRFASIKHIAAETPTTLHVAEGYVKWRNASPWCECWKHDRVWHWRPNEQFIDFLKSGEKPAEQVRRKKTGSSTQ